MGHLGQQRRSMLAPSMWSVLMIRQKEMQRRQKMF
ncbi:hypothetical protein E2C01_077169 [Portunus trituberculatus]|uniref:Uncharacterized protein n=1 Tax=Portunus trituberculatus TaxID=210409 RepID=A0A5B7IP21_PORTR|nr:hypothetical protein [Portunus trituberculatus]